MNKEENPLAPQETMPLQSHFPSENKEENTLRLAVAFSFGKQGGFDYVFYFQ